MVWNVSGTQVVTTKTALLREVGTEALSLGAGCEMFTLVGINKRRNVRVSFLPGGGFSGTPPLFVPQVACSKLLLEVFLPGKFGLLQS